MGAQACSHLGFRLLAAELGEGVAAAPGPSLWSSATAAPPSPPGRLVHRRPRLLCLFCVKQTSGKAKPGSQEGAGATTPVPQPWAPRGGAALETSVLRAPLQAFGCRCGGRRGLPWVPRLMMFWGPSPNFGQIFSNLFRKLEFSSGIHPEDRTAGAGVPLRSFGTMCGAGLGGHGQR